MITMRCFALLSAICLAQVLGVVRLIAEDDFHAYLRQHDIVYRRPPAGGHDGMPIGNRVLGGMVYSEAGDYKIGLAKDDLWDHRTLDYELSHHGLTHAKVLEKLSKGEVDSLTKIPRDRFAEFWGDRPVQRISGWMPYPAREGGVVDHGQDPGPAVRPATAASRRRNGTDRL
jgi:hypothetical protein